MTKEQFIDEWIKPITDVVGSNPHYKIHMKEALDLLLQAERGIFLQSKLEDYDVGSLEYKIIESMLKE